MNPGEAARPPSARHVEQSLLDAASASARADLAPASEALDRVTEVKRDPTPADLLPKPAPEEKPAKERVSKPATAKKTASKAPRRCRGGDAEVRNDFREIRSETHQVRIEDPEKERKAA